MTTSLYKLSEQCRSILGKGSYQELSEAVKEAYGAVVKLNWYENRNDGVNEVDGVFIYTFGKSSPITPTQDALTGQYYITVPSGYLRLPHEMGVNYVGFMKGGPFIRISSGVSGIWNTIKSGVLGGSQTYFVEGTKMFFPKMTSDSVGNILLKMAIAFDTIEADEELNIPPDISAQIIDMVVQRYTQKEKQVPEKLI